MTTTAEIIQRAESLRNNGQGVEAAELYREAAGIYSKAGNERQAAKMQHMRGVAYKVEDKIDLAIPCLEEAATSYRNLDDTEGLGRTERDIGICHAYRGDFDLALDWLKQSERTLEPLNNAEYGISESKLGYVLMELQDLSPADDWLHRGLRTLRRSNHWFYELTTLMHLADLKLREGNPSHAVDHSWAALGILLDRGELQEHKRRAAQLYGFAAKGYVLCGDHARARDLFIKAMGHTETMPRAAARVVFRDIDAANLLLEINDPESTSKYSSRVNSTH